MLLVKTKIGPSKKHGIGLFANQFIAKGTPTWRYTAAFDASFTKEEIDTLPDYARERFFDFSYFDKKINRFVLPFDDLRFINHSTEHANIHSTPREDIAARDINAGEELVCDYESYEKGYFARRGIDPSTFI